MYTRHRTFVLTAPNVVAFEINLGNPFGSMRQISNMVDTRTVFSRNRVIYDCLYQNQLRDVIKFALENRVTGPLIAHINCNV